MLGLKLNHVSKRGHCGQTGKYKIWVKTKNIEIKLIDSYILTGKTRKGLQMGLNFNRYFAVTT